MADIKIYHGDRIGGCVTVISAVADGATHRIMIDYGASLKGSKTEVDLKYPWDDAPIDAVFFTHYHGDHVGRLMEIPAEIPLYMGETARQVMITIHSALANRQVLDVLQDDARIHTFSKNGRTYDAIDDIPGFHIEPYSVDHSAYDSYMFLIEAEDAGRKDGKHVILHTGDIRGHGRRGKATIPMIEKYIHKDGRQVNTLIIEGTMMSRPNETVMTETEMMDKVARYIEEHKYAFLICSSTNLDSLASFYQAARKHDRYMFVYSDYFKKQLETFSETAGAICGIYLFHNVYKLDLDKELYSPHWPRPKTQKELMESKGSIAVIKPEEWCDKYIAPFIEDYESGVIDQMPVIIYSMWSGYLNENNEAKKQEWIDFINRQQARGVEVKYLHTSGHATAEMLAEIITAVAPTDEILPIHTECPEAFRDLDISAELKDKIQLA